MQKYFSVVRFNHLGAMHDYSRSKPFHNLALKGLNYIMGEMYNAMHDV